MRQVRAGIYHYWAVRVYRFTIGIVICRLPARRCGVRN